MKARMVTLGVSLAALAACAFLWPPKRYAFDTAFAFEEPALPDAVDLPQPCEIPEMITIFGAKPYERRSIAVGHEKQGGVTYRLCSYAGDEELWVVGVQDSEGHFYTLRSGERIPGTSLEFRNIRFRTADTGLQKGDAVFFDSANANYVDVMACLPNEKAMAQ